MRTRTTTVDPKLRGLGATARGGAENLNGIDKDDAFYQEDWWVELLEEEVEPNLKEDLELLLKNSRADRRILSSLKETRKAIKDSDDVSLPESGLYYQNLHDKIMAALDEETDFSPRRTSDAFMAKQIAKTRLSWRTMAGTFGMTMMVAALTWITLQSSPDTELDSRAVAEVDSMPGTESAEENFERNLAMVSAEEATHFTNEMNGFVSEEDLVTQAAIEKLQNLSPEEADALLASLER